jgi:hypothetical protein
VLLFDPRTLAVEIANNDNAVRFLDLIKPFTPLLPEVAAPESKIPFNQKLMWTGVRDCVHGDNDGRETNEGDSHSVPF